MEIAIILVVVLIGLAAGDVALVRALNNRRNPADRNEPERRGDSQEPRSEHQSDTQPSA
jgi:hypothetical protein